MRTCFFSNARSLHELEYVVPLSSTCYNAQESSYRRAQNFSICDSEQINTSLVRVEFIKQHKGYLFGFFLF